MPNNNLYWYNSKVPRKDLVKRLRYADVPRKLGVTAQYSNVMYSVAGEAAANVAGTSYETLVHDKVIRPLGLNNTGFTPMKMKRHSDNHALPFRGVSYEAVERGQFNILPLNEIYMSTAPAGDIYSNVLDMVRWGKAIMDKGALDGKQILNETSVEETLNAHSIYFAGRRDPEAAPVLTYGFGWIQDSFKGQNFYRHSKCRRPFLFALFCSFHFY